MKRESQTFLPTGKTRVLTDDTVAEVWFVPADERRGWQPWKPASPLRECERFVDQLTPQMAFGAGSLLVRVVA